MQMGRYAEVSSPDASHDEEAWAIQAQQYVTLDEYFTHERVSYATVPGHKEDVNQRYALVRLNHGSFAIIARNMNCFYGFDERTRIVERCRTPEQIREGMQRFAAMKQAALYNSYERDNGLGR